VVVQATDNVGVIRVEILVDSKLMASKEATPYEFPLVLQPGTRQLVAMAYDKANNKGSATISITVKGDPGPNPNPTPTPTPDSGVTPTPTPAPGSFGAPCGGPADCGSKLCIEDQGIKGRYCSQQCNAATVCPTNADCLQATSGTWICALRAAPANPGAPAAPRGGCSQVPGAPAAGAIAVALIALALIALRRRRG
jgi:MYXO-CTERM domain-containing protein